MPSFHPSWPAPEPAIQRMVQKRLDGRVKPGHEERGTVQPNRFHFGASCP